MTPAKQSDRDADPTRSGPSYRTKHLGADLPAEIVDAFAAQCDARGFKQKRVLEALAVYWQSLPEIVQMDLYHGRHHLEALRESIVEVLRELELLPARDQAAGRPGRR